MEEIKSVEEEKIPAGVVTMLLTGYLETIKRLTWALVITVICLLCSWGGFLYYLSQYEVEITNYGNFENSHVNASTGQQADTMHNYYKDGVITNGENKK